VLCYRDVCVLVLCVAPYVVVSLSCLVLPCRVLPFLVFALRFMLCCEGPSRIHPSVLLSNFTFTIV
jgi:hypothetical protein